MAENSSPGTQVGAAVAATDADGDTLYYSLSGADAGSFEVGGQTGQITVKNGSGLDHETKPSYAVTVGASDRLDDRGDADTVVDATVAVTVNVADVAEPPGKVGGVGVSAAAAAGHARLSVSWNAPANRGPALRPYALQHRRKGTAGWTALAPAPAGGATDAAVGGLSPHTTYQVRVGARNAEGDGAWSDTAEGATANRPPRFGAAATRSVAENAAAGTRVGAAVAATDPDGDTLAYTLGGSGEANFTVGADGQIAVAAGAALNHETGPRLALTLQADDGFGGTATVAVTVNVADVAEPPGKVGGVGVSAAATDGHANLAVSWSAPANSGPALRPYALQHRRKGTAGWTALAPAPAGGATGATVGGLSPHTTYQVRVGARNAEGDGAWSDTAEGATANRPPRFGAAATRSVAENAAAGTDVGAAVAATDPDGDTLAYTLGGSGAANFTVGADGQIAVAAGAALNHETGPRLALTLQADDGFGGTATVAVTVNVADVAEPPGKVGGVGVSAAAADGHANLAVSWSAPANSGPALRPYALQHRRKGTAGWTALAPAPAGGATGATVGGLSPHTTYQVRVGARNAEGDGAWSDTAEGATANRPPRFGAAATRSVAENAAAGTDVGAAVAATDPDGDTLAYTLGGSGAANFTVGADGQIAVAAGAALNHETGPRLALTLQADDGFGGEATIAVTVNVADVNEPPGKVGGVGVAAAATDGHANLAVSWDAPANAGPALGPYALEYRADGTAGWTALAPAPAGGATAAAVGGLSPHTTYQVRLRARSAEGDGAWSDTAEGRTNTTCGDVTCANGDCESWFATVNGACSPGTFALGTHTNTRWQWTCTNGELTQNCDEPRFGSRRCTDAMSVAECACRVRGDTWVDPVPERERTCTGNRGCTTHTHSCTTPADPAGGYQVVHLQEAQGRAVVRVAQPRDLQSVPGGGGALPRRHRSPRVSDVLRRRRAALSMTGLTRTAVAGLALWALAGCGGRIVLGGGPAAARAAGAAVAVRPPDVRRPGRAAAADPGGGGVPGEARAARLVPVGPCHVHDGHDAEGGRAGRPHSAPGHPARKGWGLPGRARPTVPRHGRGRRSTTWWRRRGWLRCRYIRRSHAPRTWGRSRGTTSSLPSRGGNTDGSRDLWQPDHPHWEDYRDLHCLGPRPITRDAWDNHLEAFGTGKVLIAVYALPAAGGGYEPNDYNMRCGEARDACMAVAARPGDFAASSDATVIVATAAFYTAQLFDGAVKVVDTLKACAVDAGEEGVDDEFGLGVLNLACPEIENAEVRTASGSLRPAWSSPALDRLAFPPVRGLSFDGGPAFADRRGRPLGRLGVSYGFRRGALAVGAGREFSPLGVSSSLSRAGAGAYVAAAGSWRLSGDPDHGLHAAAAAGRGGGALSPRAMRAGLLYGGSSDGVDWSAYAGRAWHRAAVGIPGHRDAGRGRSRATAAGWEARVVVRWRF